MSVTSVQTRSIPFFRPSIGDEEAAGVLDVLRSGWLTTGRRVAEFETAFAAAVGARHAIALNSATAALHLALEALGLKSGQGVLVPTMTFAATGEVVRYLNAVPILVDCMPGTFELDLRDAESKLERAINGALLPGVGRTHVAGVVPVHVGGLLGDMQGVRSFSERHGLWVVEDAAHAFPAAWRRPPAGEWIRCGQGTADVTCFSFYANKTITTGEGGMAVTDDDSRAERIRLMSLHGLSKDAWRRYTGDGSWDYRIVAPGFKYNLTDVAAAIGLPQLERAEEMRAQRERLALRYLFEFADVDAVTLPPNPPDRLHAWHLFPIALNLDMLRIDRARFMHELKELGVATSVHWRPLHLHPYYAETFGWTPEHLPVASREWLRLISLPIFPSMTAAEQDHVVGSVRHLCRSYRR